MEENDPYDVEFLLYQRETSPEQYLSGTNPVLRAIIDGVCDEGSFLSLLNGLPHIVRDIWDYIILCWKNCIKDRKTYDKRKNQDKLPVYVKQLDGLVITFPKPENLYINMMPFVMETTFERCRLPSYLKPYWEQILNKTSFYDGSVIQKSEIGKIGYLTIHECYVKENTCQRRGGLHTDCPGKLMIVPDETDRYMCVGRVTEEEEEMVCEKIDQLGLGYIKEKIINYTHPWGMTLTRRASELVGGIYMASNVSNSCAAWNCQIEADVEGGEIIGHLGDVEHLRDVLPGEPVKMEANRMYWLTDRTPHESLPLVVGAYRQYFRLVTSNVSVWFEEHSTKNPCGVVPDPAITKIVKGSKFEDNLALLLDMDPATAPPGELGG